MSWKRTDEMNERTILIGEWLSQEFSLSELARRRGISRKSAYKWISRYRESGLGGLKDLSRTAHSHPNAISLQIKQAILDWKEARPLWGAPKIHSKLVGMAGCPAESTVSNVLKRHGWVGQVRRRNRAVPTFPAALANASGPNEVWCADFKGWFRVRNGQRCDPLTISDAHSRFLLCCRGLAGATGLQAVRPWFEGTFREYGLPRVIRTDNGPPFASVGLGGLSRLAVWWLRLGILVERIEPGHPEQNGRHERMHRTLKEAPRRDLWPPICGRNKESLIAFARNTTMTGRTKRWARNHLRRPMLPRGENIPRNYFHRSMTLAGSSARCAATGRFAGKEQNGL